MQQRPLRWVERKKDDGDRQLKLAGLQGCRGGRKRPTTRLNTGRRWEIRLESSVWSGKIRFFRPCHCWSFPYPALFFFSLTILYGTTHADENASCYWTGLS